MAGLLWLALGGGLLTAGDIIFKYWITRALPIFSGVWIGGMLIYIAGLACLVQSFKSQNIAVASAIFVIFNIVSLALVSWFIFGERLSLQQIGGIALAFCAIVLLR